MTKPRYKIIVCRGRTCGGVHGSTRLYDRLKVALGENHADDRVDIEWRSCFGRCSYGPNLFVRESRLTTEGGAGLAVVPITAGSRSALYNRVTIDDIDAIVEEHIGNGEIVARLIVREPPMGAPKTPLAAVDIPPNPSDITAKANRESASLSPNRVEGESEPESGD